MVVPFGLCQPLKKKGETRKPTEEKYGGWTSKVYNSGQIIATSHDLTPNGGLGRDLGPSTLPVGRSELANGSGGLITPWTFHQRA